MSRGWIIVGVAALFAVGCQKTEPVTKYKAPRLETPRADIGGGAPVKLAPARFLAAMFPAGDRIWFFRLTGPAEEIAPFAKDFEGLIQTVRVAPGAEKPTAKLPAGWEELPGKESIRMGIKVKIAAFIKLPGAEGRQIEISSLENPDFHMSTKGILLNLNRWGGMVNRGPFDEADIAKVTRRISVGGTEVVLVDIEGMSGAGGGLPAGHPPVGHPALPKASSTLPFKAEVPKGWKVAASGEAGLISFGESLVVFSKTSEEPNWPKVIDNLGRKFGIASIAPDRIAAGQKSIDLGGRPASFVELTLPEAEHPSGLVGVHFSHGKDKWMFVLICPLEELAAAKTELLTFLRSIRFETDKG